MLPSIRASLAQRFVFNYRMPPAALTSLLPVSWLRPLLVRGQGVASFCILDLRNITVAPLPTVAGLRSISCARRYAVLDESGGRALPAVFVSERQTNSAFGSWFTSLGFSAPHAYVNAAIDRVDARTLIHVEDAAKQTIFSATTEPSEHCPTSVFAHPEDFAAFLERGVTSYGASRHRGKLTIVNLVKEDASYESLDATAVVGSAVTPWLELGATFDSAFRTGGHRYEWTYKGMT